MSHHLLLLSLVAFIISKAAQSQNVAWINPPIAGANHDYSADQAWEIGSTQTLSWESSYPTATVILNQQHLDATPRQITLVEGLVGTEFAWVVNLGTLSLNGDETLPIFYLGVNASDSSGDFLYVTAHYINITAEAVTTSSSAMSSSTTSSSTPTSSSTSSKAASASTQSSTGLSTNSNTSTSSPSTKKNSGLSTGAAAGIAVACTLTVVSFLAGLGYFYYRNRKLRRQLAQATASESGGWMKPELGVSGARGELAAQVAELGPGYHLGHELDGRETWDR